MTFGLFTHIASRALGKHIHKYVPASGSPRVLVIRPCRVLCSSFGSFRAFIIRLMPGLCHPVPTESILPNPDIPSGGTELPTVCPSLLGDCPSRSQFLRPFDVSLSGPSGLLSGHYVCSGNWSGRCPTAALAAIWPLPLSGYCKANATFSVRGIRLPPLRLLLFGHRSGRWLCGHHNPATLAASLGSHPNDVRLSSSPAALRPFRLMSYHSLG